MSAVKAPCLLTYRPGRPIQISEKILTPLETKNGFCIF